MIWPAWLWIGTPVKFATWLVNRLATWSGSFYLWKRLRSHRFFWLWFVVINTVSMGMLVAALFWLHHHFSH